jgi:hypothetical protein
MASNGKPMTMGQKLGQKMSDTIMPVNKVLRDSNAARAPKQYDRSTQRNDAANMRAEVARVQARRAMDAPARKGVADPDESLTRPKTKAKAKGGMMKMGMAKKPMAKKAMMKKPTKRK